MTKTDELLPRAQTGIFGLDSVLRGGLARNRLHLLEGSPGTGKTTIALQFLLAGHQSGEVGIYISLAETEQELREGARSHSWEIPKGIEIFELVPPESVLDPDQHQSLLYSSDLELGETMQRIFETIFPHLAQGFLADRKRRLAIKSKASDDELRDAFEATLTLLYRLLFLLYAESRDLLEIFDDRHGTRSTIVTSQLPVETWHDYVADPTIADALLDRIVHNAHRLKLKGPSKRKTET